MRGRRRLTIGPGALVAAAFIGPGTVTTCTLAGARTGSTLLWALTFSVLATLVLQEMSLRLGVVGDLDLAEALRKEVSSPFAARTASALVLVAVVFGCAAYETGNLLGAALGLQAMAGLSPRLLAPLVGAVAAAILWQGSYRVMERILVGMVIIMSLTFLGTAVVSGAGWGEVVRGALTPSTRGGADLYLVVALIGTTVVPYNLFLHASAVRERFEGPADLPAARTDAVVTILLGGVVSGAVVLTAAGAFYPPPAGAPSITTAGDMAVQLEPLLGRWATVFFSIGLLAAGISSGITAPMAAAYASQGILGWEPGITGPRQRSVALGVVGVGMLFGALGVRPVPAITLAQAANGILLPVVAVFLLLAANDRRRLRDRANGPAANLVGGAVVLIAAGLGIWALARLAGLA
ncbi:MAG: Nramp family divalent metal transporter [bacterium]